MNGNSFYVPTGIVKIGVCESVFALVDFYGYGSVRNVHAGVFCVYFEVSVVVTVFSVHSAAWC